MSWPGRRWCQRSREQQTSSGMTKAGRLSPQVLGPGLEVEGTSGAVDHRRFREWWWETALQGSSGFGSAGRAGWLSARRGRIPSGYCSRLFPGCEECQRATRGVRNEQVGEYPLRRADVEAGVKGPSGA